MKSLSPHFSFTKLENGDSNRSRQSDGVHCAQLLLAAGTKLRVLSLYFKEKTDKKTLPIEANGLTSVNLHGLTLR